MTIWMVTGLHKAQWTKNVQRNFRRQAHGDKRLIVVLNGACAQSDPSIWQPGVVVLHSGADPAKVMNTALSYLHTMADPNDWFCKCDADDYYGPRYLEHVAANTLSDFSGLKSMYVKSQDNKLWFAEGNGRTAIVHGPTIAGRIGTAIPFKEGLDWGEDTAWCEEMERYGRDCSVRPSDGFCYQRWSNYTHTWPCTDEELLAAWPIPMYELGPFDENVVDGLRAHRYSKLLEQRELTAKNSMPVRVLINRLTKGNNMKTIKIPEHEVATGDGTTVKLSWFVMFIINNHSEFNRDGSGIRASMHIENAVSAATKNESDAIELEDADWVRLSQAVENPSCGYPVQPARAALPWIEAIKNAT